MFPDGVSYLDVGDAFWGGNFHDAINAYWSPLYPCVLGLFLKIFKPSVYWEYPLVHLMNFVLYAAALVCFAAFLNILIEQLELSKEDATRSEIGLPVWAWYIAGYSAFVSSALLLISVRFPSPDMMVAALLFLASALLLKIRTGKATWGTFVSLGLVLGIAYLAKAVMFLLAVPFLFVTTAVQWNALRRVGYPQIHHTFAGTKTLNHSPLRNLKPVVLCLLTFVVVAFPFVLLLSARKHRPTFGDSGRINYEITVNQVQFFIPQEKTIHPVGRIPGVPDAFEYAKPIGGTYPLWFDPSYWHEGLEAHFQLLRQLRMLGLSLLTCAWISFNVFLGLGITTAVFVLYLSSPSIRHCLTIAGSNWELWLPSVSGIGLYCLVVVEPRYVAGMFCVLWLVAFSGVRLPRSRASRRLFAGVVLGMAAATCLISGWQSFRAWKGIGIAEKHIATAICWQVAEAIHSRGIRPGDTIAVVAAWLVPDQEASYVARLARVRIVAEARPEGFWALEAARSQFAAEVKKVGGKAILAYQPPRTEQGWERLANTDYYLYRLTSSAD
jgi:hypothetical protein